MTLNGWLVELIEASIEDMHTTKTTPNDEIARLRKEILDMKRRVAEAENARTSIQLDKSVVDYLRNGGVIKYPVAPSRSNPSKISGNWMIVDIISGRTKQTTGKPTETNIQEFIDELHYKTVRIIGRDNDTRILTVRPVDKAGAGIAVSDDANSLIDTLTLLEDWELIEHTRKGWKWIS
jgi:hypothetical protein